MKKSLINLTLATLVAMTALVGCGKRSMPTAPADDPAPVVTPTPAATPTPEPTVNPNPQPTVAPVTARLSASVTSKKNGSLFGIGSYVVTVDVINDSTETLSGELQVQFLNGTKADPTHLKTLQVALQSGERQSFSFEDKSWGIDDATVNVTTAQATQYSQASYNNSSSYGTYNNSYSYSY